MHTNLYIKHLRPGVGQQGEATEEGNTEANFVDHSHSLSLSLSLSLSFFEASPCPPALRPVLMFVSQSTGYCATPSVQRLDHRGFEAPALQTKRARQRRPDCRPDCRKSAGECFRLKPLNMHLRHTSLISLITHCKMYLTFMEHLFIYLFLSLFKYLYPPPPQQLSLSLTITVLSSPLWCQCGQYVISCLFISGKICVSL